MGILLLLSGLGFLALKAEEAQAATAEAPAEIEAPPKVETPPKPEPTREVPGALIILGALEDPVTAVIQTIALVGNALFPSQEGLSGAEKAKIRRTEEKRRGLHFVVGDIDPIDGLPFGGFFISTHNLNDFLRVVKRHKAGKPLITIDRPIWEKWKGRPAP